MSSEAPRKDNRFRLGPKAMTLLDRCGDGTPQEFDEELVRLVFVDAEHRKTAAKFEVFAARLHKIEAKLNATVEAQLQTVAAIGRLHDKLDQRGAQLVKMHNHTSGLIGTRLTEGTERKRLLVQFQDLFASIERQLEQITLLVKERIRDARGHLEDARRDGLDMVQVADPSLERREPDIAPVRDRGMER